jgi:cell division protein FtsW (lipid II flippase)
VPQALVGFLILVVIFVGLLVLVRAPWLPLLAVALWVVAGGTLVGYLMGRDQERRLLRWFDEVIRPLVLPSPPTSNRPGS